MEFNVWKCNIISVTNATKNKIHHWYTMNGETLSPTDTTIYLGVTINNKLLWNHHINNISAATKRMLGFLWRTMHKCPKNSKERAFKTIVWPKVEYCASIWDPHHGKYIESIEKVQRKAAHFVTNKPYRYDLPASMMSLIQDLSWESLQDRRLHLLQVSWEYGRHPSPVPPWATELPYQRSRQALPDSPAGRRCLQVLLHSKDHRRLYLRGLCYYTSRSSNDKTYGCTM